MERVRVFRFLGMELEDGLNWKANSREQLKKAHLALCFHRGSAERSHARTAPVVRQLHLRGKERAPQGRRVGWDNHRLHPGPDLRHTTPSTSWTRLFHLLPPGRRRRRTKLRNSFSNAVTRSRMFQIHTFCPSLLCPSRILFFVLCCILHNI